MSSPAGPAPAFARSRATAFTGPSSSVTRWQSRHVARAARPKRVGRPGSGTRGGVYRARVTASSPFGRRPEAAQPVGHGSEDRLVAFGSLLLEAGLVGIWRLRQARAHVRSRFEPGPDHQHRRVLFGLPRSTAHSPAHSPAFESRAGSSPVRLHSVKPPNQVAHL